MRAQQNGGKDLEPFELFYLDHKEMFLIGFRILLYQILEIFFSETIGALLRHKIE